MIVSFEQHVKESGFFQSKRKNQQKHQMYDTIRQYLTDHFNHHNEVGKITPGVIKELEDNLLTPYQAASKLLNAYFSDLKH
jgi:LAO/AO transport system kinase